MKERNQLLSADGKVNLDYYVYQPESWNGTVVQIAHGMAEHKERYNEVCTYLQSYGYMVVIHDHRGHGKSINEEHPWGHMGDNGFEQAVWDIHCLTRLIKDRFKVKKYVLLGHSMGSLMARRYLTLFGDEVDGVILSGTPSPQGGLMAGAAIADLIMKFKGPKHRSGFLNALVFGSFNKSFANRTGFEWLNRDEKQVDAYVDDEACGYIFSARSFFDLFIGTKRVFSDYPKPIKNGDLPILFVSGEEDPCGQMTAGVQACIDHLKEQDYHNVEVKLYAQMRHEILLDPDHHLVYEDINRFITMLR